MQPPQGPAQPRKPSEGFALFKRFPRLRWQPPEKPQQIISLADQARYPAFAEDFAVLEQELMPAYRILSNEAARGQNQFHLEQVTLILGGALVTALGALQVTLAALFHASLWPGVAEAVLAAVLAGVAQYTRISKAQRRYFGSRRQAEALRGEYFLFLGHLPPYDSEQRQQRLREQVYKIAPNLPARIKGGGHVA
jgi:hypothetical protein